MGAQFSIGPVENAIGLEGLPGTSSKVFVKVLNNNALEKVNVNMDLPFKWQEEKNMHSCFHIETTVI